MKEVKNPRKPNLKQQSQYEFPLKENKAHWRGW